MLVIICPVKAEPRSCSLMTLSFYQQMGYGEDGWGRGEQGTWAHCVICTQRSLSLPSSPAGSSLLDSGQGMNGSGGGVALLLRDLMVHLPGGTLRLQSPPSQILSRPSHGLSLVIEFPFLSLPVCPPDPLIPSTSSPSDPLQGMGFQAGPGVLP